MLYASEKYQCWQSHTSEPNWMPPAVPALWKDMGPCPGSVPILYPNPATTSGTVQLQVPLEKTEDVKVEVYTSAFRKIQQADYPNEPVGKGLALDLSDRWGSRLANGLYYVRVEAGGQKWVVKLLVVR